MPIKKYFMVQNPSKSDEVNQLDTVSKNLAYNFLVLTS